MNDSIQKIRKFGDIVHFTGFDDDDFENCGSDEETPQQTNDQQLLSQQSATNMLVVGGGEKKRRRGNRKNRQRMNALVVYEQQEAIQAQLQQHQEEQNKCTTEKVASDIPVKTCNKASRLVEELHQRERVRGMDRFEARQLLHDKLLFRGETDLSEIRTKRFCVVTVSKQPFDLEDGSHIPSETVTISMENGKISSVLRLVPTYADVDAESLADKNCKYRMKTVYWNPKRVKDSNMMFKMWSYFLERCLHSLLLVPLSQLSILLDFLRKMNEIRSVLNNRTTVSICLSRVISIEDFLISMQHLSDIHSSIAATPSQKMESLLDHGVELCHHFIHAMKIISNTSVETTALRVRRSSTVDDPTHTPDGLLVGPPPGLSGLTVRQHQPPFNGGGGPLPLPPAQRPETDVRIISNHTNNNTMDHINRHNQQKLENLNYMRHRNLCYSQHYYNEMAMFNNFQMGDLYQKLIRTQQMNHNNHAHNNNNFKYTSTEVQLYQRIFTWVNSIDFRNMCSFDELQNVYTGTEGFLSSDEISDIEDII